MATTDLSQNRRCQMVGKYELGKVLAAGDFDCRTRLCTHVVTGALYVVRIYKKSVLAEASWMWARVKEAIHVLRTLPKHENIVETVECFETDSSLYILMQYFSPMRITAMYTMEEQPSVTNANGNNNHAVISSGTRVAIPIQKTQHYFRQVVQGVLHMHNNSVVHTGLAPDHIMVNDRDEVKIGYMVSCFYCPRDKKIREMRGTLHTVAPEALKNEQPYDPFLSDSWALGILFYFMLHRGNYPHDGANTTKAILSRRMREVDANLPPSARDLLSRLLQHKPSRRLPVEGILAHPFFTDTFISAYASRGLVQSSRPREANFVKRNSEEASDVTQKDRGEPNRNPNKASPLNEYGSKSPCKSPVSDRQTPLQEKGGDQDSIYMGPVWDPFTETSQLQLPNGLSREEEAAYVIQHAYRVYRQRKIYRETTRELVAMSLRGSEGPDVLDSSMMPDSPSGSAAGLRYGSPRRINSGYGSFRQATSFRRNGSSARMRSWVGKNSGTGGSFTSLSSSPPHRTLSSRRPGSPSMGGAHGNTEPGIHRSISNASLVKVADEIVFEPNNSRVHSRGREAGGIIYTSNSMQKKIHLQPIVTNLPNYDDMGYSNSRIPDKASGLNTPAVTLAVETTKPAMGEKNSERINSPATPASQQSSPIPTPLGGLSLPALAMARLEFDPRQRCPLCSRLPARRTTQGKAPYSKTTYVYSSGAFNRVEKKDKDSSLLLTI